MEFLTQNRTSPTLTTYVIGKYQNAYSECIVNDDLSKLIHDRQNKTKTPKMVFKSRISPNVSILHILSLKWLNSSHSIDYLTLNLMRRLQVLINPSIGNDIIYKTELYGDSQGNYVIWKFLLWWTCFTFCFIIQYL